MQSLVIYKAKQEQLTAHSSALTRKSNLELLKTQKMKTAIIFSSLLLYVAATGYGGSYGAGGHGGGSGHDDSHNYYAPAAYNFGYDVTDQKSYVNMGHIENRNGDSTKGSYYVHLPDGRLQKTEYFVSGKSGFVPKVSYQQTGAAYGSAGAGSSGGYGGGHGYGGSSGKGY